jgi:predicted ferric reductase
VTEPENPTPPPEPPRRSDYSPWNWLLAVAVIVPLLPFLFNYATPRLFGFPLFYWLQILFILLGVGATTIVYQVAKRRR